MRYRQLVMWGLFLVVLVSACGGGGGDGPAPGTTGTPMDFVVAFPSNAGLTLTPALSLLISGQPGIQGTVSIPGLSFTASFTTDISGSAIVSIPSTAMLDAWDTVQQKGILVHANDRVAVVAISDLPGSMGAYAVQPATKLGLRHYLASAGSGANIGSFLTVVATAEGTAVEITPSVASSGHAAGQPFVISLGRGGTYQLAADDAGGDLAGTLVQSTQPVAVFGGHIAGQVPSSSGYSGFLVGQTPDTTKLGIDFITVPFATRSQYRIRLIGTDDSTTITAEGASIPFTIDAGQAIDVVAVNAVRILANKPLLLVQLAEGSEADGVAGADACMAVIPPISSYANSYVFSTPAASANVASRYANLVVPAAAITNLRLNDVVVGASAFSPIGATGYHSATVSLPAGTNRFTSDGTPFGVMVYGWGTAGSENGYCFAPFVHAP